MPPASACWLLLLLLMMLLLLFDTIVANDASSSSSSSSSNASINASTDDVPSPATEAPPRHEDMMSLDEWKDKVLSSAKGQDAKRAATGVASVAALDVGAEDDVIVSVNANTNTNVNLNSNESNNGLLELSLATTAAAVESNLSTSSNSTTSSSSSIDSNVRSVSPPVQTPPAANAVTFPTGSDGVIVASEQQQLNDSNDSVVTSPTTVVSSTPLHVDVLPVLTTLKPVAASSREAEALFDQFNYAAVECGAKVLDANREATEISSVISRSVDHYMLNECGAEMWFAAELCEEIMITAVMLQNAEFFSSMVRHVDLLASNSYPAREGEWRLLARLELANSREPQRFILPSVSAADLSDDSQDHFFKFVKVNLTSYYGSEFYCPLTRFAVHGVTVSHAISEHLQLDSKLVTELQSVIKSSDVPLHPPAAAVQRRPPMCLREDAALYFQRQCRRENAPIAANASAAAQPPSPASSTPLSWSSDGAVGDVTSDLDDAVLLDATHASFAAFRAANLDGTSPRADLDFEFTTTTPSPPPVQRVITPAADVPPSAARDQIVPLRDVQVKKSTESIFRMLAARVKSLEINQTLIDRYLEQLTKQYVQNPSEQRQLLADSLRKCNAALAGAERARDRAERAAATMVDNAALEAVVATRVAALTSSLTAQIDALRDESARTKRLLQFDMIVTAVISFLLSMMVSVVGHLCLSSERRTFRMRPLEREREREPSPVAHVHQLPPRSPVKMEPSPIVRQRKGSEPAPIGLILKQMPRKKWAPFDDGVPIESDKEDNDDDVDIDAVTCAVDKQQQSN